MVRTGRVDDAELAALYAGARATVLPSHLEGFGFTPLESLAAGTPVVVSDLPVLRETLGDAAVFVPPGDSGALAAAIRAVVDDARLRDRLHGRRAGRPGPAELGSRGRPGHGHPARGGRAGEQAPRPSRS